MISLDQNPEYFVSGLYDRSQDQVKNEKANTVESGEVTTTLNLTRLAGSGEAY